MRQRHLVDERRALHHVRGRVDMGGVVHRGRDALRQHARLRHVVDALDLDVFEIRPVRRLVAEAMGQIVELEPHGVVVVLLERHAANFLRHATPPSSTPTYATLIALGGIPLYRISAIDPALDGATRKRSRKRMVKKIALEEHFLSPGLDDYWKPTVGDVAPEDRGEHFFARSDRFRRAAAAKHGWRRHCARGAVARRAPACRPSATPRPPSARRAKSNDFLAREIEKRPDRYSGFAHLRDAGRQGGRRRTRALHAAS